MLPVVTLGRVEELVRGGDVAIDNQYNGHTALQAASQVWFYLEILFWGGNMVNKDSKKGHNLCYVQ